VAYFEYLRRRMGEIQGQFAVIVSSPRIKPGTSRIRGKAADCSYSNGLVLFFIVVRLVRTSTAILVIVMVFHRPRCERMPSKFQVSSDRPHQPARSKNFDM
jgi:hypothetical protein